VNASAPPKGHDTYEALAVAWVLDALEPADQVIFEEHRHGCDVCELTVLTTLEVAAELAYGVPDIEPPAQLRRRVLSAATSRPPVQATSPEGAAGPRAGEPDGPPAFATLDLFGDADRSRGRDTASGGDRGLDTGEAARTGADGSAGVMDGSDALRDAPDRVVGQRRASGARARSRTKPALARDDRRSAGSGSRRRRVVSVLVAAALVGISAVTTWEVTRPAAVTAPVAASERTAALSPPAGEGIVATVVARDGRADVVTDALTPNPAGRRFFMWGVPADGTGMPQLVGTFRVTTSGLHSYPVELSRSLEDYQVLAISEEAAGSKPTGPSSVIAPARLAFRPRQVGWSVRPVRRCDECPGAGPRPAQPVRRCQARVAARRRTTARGRASTTIPFRRRTRRRATSTITSPTAQNTYCADMATR
jgi:anti-sigma-K factor RskA